MELYEVVRFKIAVRKTLLRQRSRSMSRGTLLNRFPAVSQELFDTGINECIREGKITTKPGQRNSVILTWHEPFTVGVEQ